MAIANHFEGSFAEKRRNLALDRERIVASAAPVRELVNIMRSVDGFNEDELFALLDWLKELKVQAIRAPQPEDTLRDVTQRLKFFASQTFSRVDAVLPQPEAARDQEFQEACTELSSKIRAWAGEYGQRHAAA